MIVNVLFYFCVQSPCKPKWRNGDEDLLRARRGLLLSVESETWFSVFRSLRARLHPKGGGDCREDGDYDVEDFTPGCVVVECSHRLVRGPTDPLCLSGISPLYGEKGWRGVSARWQRLVGFC